MSLLALYLGPSRCSWPSHSQRFVSDGCISFDFFPVCPFFNALLFFFSSWAYRYSLVILLASIPGLFNTFDKEVIQALNASAAAAITPRSWWNSVLYLSIWSTLQCQSHSKSMTACNILGLWIDTVVAYIQGTKYQWAICSADAVNNAPAGHNTILSSSLNIIHISDLTNLIFFSVLDMHSSLFPLISATTISSSSCQLLSRLWLHMKSLMFSSLDVVSLVSSPCVYAEKLSFVHTHIFCVKGTGRCSDSSTF